MPVVIKGLAETRSALRKFEPDLLKESDREMRQVLRVIVTDARSLVPSTPPLRGWSAPGQFPGFSPNAMRMGIKPHIGKMKANINGFSSVYSIRQMDAAGAIYELAGSKNPHGQPWGGPSASKTNHKVSHSRNPNAGAQFIDAVSKQSNQATPRTKMDGRIVAKAVKRDEGKAYRAIYRSVHLAELKFELRTQARGAFGGE